MNAKRMLLSVALITLVTGCTAATKTSKLSVAPQDAMRCAADTMASLGYSVSDAGSDGLLQGERDKHARSPFGGQSDFDRITVLVSDSRKAPAMRVIGETLRSGGTRGLQRSQYEGMPMRFWTSGAVRSDTKRIAETCSGVASEQPGSNGS